MYAVVAPGFKGVYEDYASVERVLALYPYTKFRKLPTEEECWEFLRKYENNRGLDEIKDFGDTFSKHHVVMEYYIKEPNIYYNFHTKGLGTIRILDDDALVENRAQRVQVLLPNVVVNPDTISGHIIAIHNGIRLLGDFLDVEVLVPDHSIFYAIRSYTGSNRSINRLRRLIDSRVGNVSISLRR